MVKALFSIAYLVVLVVSMPDLDISKVQTAEASATESCSTVADCNRLCGASGECVLGICTCGGRQEEVFEEAMADLSCSGDSDCEIRCSPVCYSKFCVEGKCQCTCID